MIALLEDFTLKIGNITDYLHEVCLCNRDTGEIFYDKLNYTYIELFKFVKTETHLETELDKWLYVLKNMSTMNKIPVYLRKPIFEKLFNIAEYSNMTKEEKTMYDRSLKYKWDNKNVLDYALKEGRERGLEQGAHQKAVEIACELKKEGLAIEFIAKTTKLSIEEIEKL